MSRTYWLNLKLSHALKVLLSWLKNKGKPKQLLNNQSSLSPKGGASIPATTTVVVLPKLYLFYTCRRRPYNRRFCLKELIFNFGASLLKLISQVGRDSKVYCTDLSSLRWNFASRFQCHDSTLLDIYCFSIICSCVTTDLLPTTFISQSDQPKVH